MDATGKRPTPVDVVYVDLDGTLTPSDSLFESVVAMVRRRPSAALHLPWWVIRGKLHFKTQVAASEALDPADLPYRADLLADLRTWRAGGAEVVLATAAHPSVADAVARHLDVFDSVLASSDHVNLRGGAKLAAIRRHADGRRYAYVGNETVDLPILADADAGYVAGPRADDIRRQIPPDTPVDVYPDQGPGVRHYLRLMRPRHWLKNLLVFVPLFASQQVSEAGEFGAALLAFCAFSLVASGNYGINDVLDIHADRRSPSRADRPVAAGILPIKSAIWLSLGLLVAGFAVAALLPAGFQLTLAAYLAVSLAYSLALKRLLLLDVVTLAAMFVLRVVAGAEAIDITTSFWLLAFSLFLFASLALAKRSSELHNLDPGASSHGRAYRTDDLAILQTIGEGFTQRGSSKVAFSGCLGNQ